MSSRIEGGELHHVSVVVPSIADALPFYRDTLHLQAGAIREIPDQHVRAGDAGRGRHSGSDHHGLIAAGPVDLEGRGR